jgi:hypothetical protein
LLNETLEKLTSPSARREFIAVRSFTDLIYDSLSGSLCGRPVLPCNQVAIDDNNVRVLLTLDILRSRLYQPHLWEPRRTVRHAKVSHFARRESSHTFPRKQPRPIICSCAE